MKRGLTPGVRTSPHLELRPFRRRDLDVFLEAVQASLPDLSRWLPWAHEGYSRPDAAAFLRESASAWNEGRAYDFAIRRLGEPDRHLGNISVWWTSRAGSSGEIGYWVRSDEAGKGVATEATARMLEVAFDEMGMHRVILRIAVGNFASERIAAKLGFSREGLLREEVRVNGVWLDHTLWALLDHEYRRVRADYAAAGWAHSPPV